MGPELSSLQEQANRSLSENESLKTELTEVGGPCMAILLQHKNVGSNKTELVIIAKTNDIHFGAFDGAQLLQPPHINQLI